MPDPKDLELDDNGNAKVTNIHQLAQGLDLTNQKVAELDQKMSNFRGRDEGTEVNWPWLKKTPPAPPATP